MPQSSKNERKVDYFSDSWFCLCPVHSTHLHCLSEFCKNLNLQPMMYVPYILHVIFKRRETHWNNIQWWKQKIQTRKRHYNVRVLTPPKNEFVIYRNMGAWLITVQFWFFSTSQRYKIFAFSRNILKFLNFDLFPNWYTWYHLLTQCWEQQWAIAPSLSHSHKEKQPIIYSVLCHYTLRSGRVGVFSAFSTYNGLIRM